MSKKKASQHKSGRTRIDKSMAAEYNYHLPVMLKETIDFLVTDTNGIYIDGTLGGGGHAAEILQRIDSGGKLYAFDKHSTAIEHCNARFAEELIRGTSSRLRLYNYCYSEVCNFDEIRGQISGLLLDLGVSSKQLDTDSLGLSYRVDSKLDMRFGDTGLTAGDLLYSVSEDELIEILRNYGEEPMARRIAKAIILKRNANSMNTTFDLRAAVESCVPTALHFKALSRVFQAIRIAVNQELKVLEDTLKGIIPMLAPGGRIVILSYHSLEDRIVKSIFKEYSKKIKVNKQHPDYNKEGNLPPLTLLTPKPMLPSEQEIQINPRARSAKLRVAEKTVVE
jgi:16S rRNA (cytosine1402-N4)-methyltransferase